MNLKKPLSFTEQIARLKEHNLIISDETFALEVLSKINYYRYSGYALQFRKEPDNSDLIDGITFEQVYKIYLFDEALRNACRKYLEKVEIYYKTQISHNFSARKCSEPPYDQHYEENNYYYKQGYDEVMDSFRTYPDLTSACIDYLELITTSPRYTGAVCNPDYNSAI